jgi:hypothetical protein
MEENFSYDKMANPFSSRKARKGLRNERKGFFSAAFAV